MKVSVFLSLTLLLFACKEASNPEPATTGSLNIKSYAIDGVSSASYSFISLSPQIVINFSLPVDTASAKSGISLNGNSGSALVDLNLTFSHGDSTVVLVPKTNLVPLASYYVKISTGIKSKNAQLLAANTYVGFSTGLDTTDKFPRISDDSLLTLVQRQTFKYFWDFGHPVSGLARERNSSGDIVTSGGSGFGIMAIVVGIERNFITRQEGLDRLTTIVNFLSNTAQKYHGAFPHWMNGSTGATIPFGTKDDGADLVETSYLMNGLLVARQYFSDSASEQETTLRQNINTLWNNVEWNWFTQNANNAVYWHWSPNYGFAMNMQVSGWNEALITYVMSASSNTHPISDTVYNNGWTRNGAFVNGKNYYGITLPLGANFGGPLFFAHYSFLGLDPKRLTDQYTNYFTQCQAHTLINYNFCVSNPNKYKGYSANCWGLTASDNNINGYSAHEPLNDLGIISPTAAVSSLPYAPTQSMNAIRYFYYKLGDRIWGQYGFVDAFNLTNIWFATSYLAIDQGPMVVMIENHRSGLVWNLFMSCPEVQRGLQKLNFTIN